MVPTMPVNAPLDGGSRNGIARCAATKYPPMRYGSVAYWPGAATSSAVMGPTWPRSFDKLIARARTSGLSSPSLTYHSPNDHKLTGCGSFFCGCVAKMIPILYT